MEMLVTAALTVVLAHLALGVVLWLRVRKLYSYPGLLGFPVIGNLYYFYRTLFLLSMDSMEKHLAKIADEYGKNGICFHWIYGYKTLVTISSPHVVKELAFHPNLSDKPELMYGGFSSYLNGPFVSSRSDEAWKLKRKEYNSCLKKTHVDNDYSSNFIKAADKLVDSMLASTSAVDVHAETLKVLFNVSLETLIGIGSSTVYHPDNFKIMAAFPALGSLVVANPTLGRFLITVIQPIDHIIFKKFAELRKPIMDGIDYNELLNHTLPQEKKEALLSMQIISRSRKHNECEKDLANEILEVFVTSTNTLASALSSSIIFLALLPDIQEKAWKEQYDIFGNDKRDPNIDDLKQMHYLDRFIKECLRFLSPPFVGKVATGDVNIDGITVPAGTIVIYLMKFIRMDPNHWKNPNNFDPDRFLEECDSFKFSYTPFGIGIRSCPGVYFAPVLMKILLSKILRRLKLRPVKKDFQFNDLQFKSCIMMELENPPKLLVGERAC
ncbi:cytochrome P450 4c21 [Halyomorpha halys]|uniref:cytochrome P450 4c21 n=1 Tax=Halyomorpha halys TaxID=286706 RepID=UPI0006D50125|nr:cytochrome P450 4c21-like [Halyomorpha halys]